MIYKEFNHREISAIDPAKFDSLLLPFIHYRPVRAIKLNNRYVLVKDKGLFDCIDELCCAKVSTEDDSVSFYRGARLHPLDLEPFIAPHKIKVVAGIWAVATKDRTLVYRDGMSTRSLYLLVPEVIKRYQDAVNGLKEYVDALDISREIEDHSFDLCEACHAHVVEHLAFHICRGEIGSRLLPELTGLTRDEILNLNSIVVKDRLFEILTLVKGTTIGGVRLTLDVSREAERYYNGDCPWGTARGGLVWR